MPDPSASSSLREIFSEEEIADAFTLLSGDRAFAIKAAAELYTIDPQLDWTLFDDAVSALATVSPSAAARVQKLTGQTDEQMRRRIADFAKRMREGRRR